MSRALPSRGRTLRSLLARTHLRVALFATGLTSLTLSLVGLAALSNYASSNLLLLGNSMVYSLEAAVVFNDRAAAEDSLRLITQTQEIAEAVVIGRNDRPLVHWQAPERDAMGWMEDRVAGLLLPQQLEIAIYHQEEEIGKLQLRGSGKPLTRVLITGLLGLFAALTLSAIGAAYGAMRVQRAIALLLEKLSAIARSIAKDRAFDRRVPAASIAELNALAEDFNALTCELDAWHGNLQEENASLAHKANHDPLTGLANRQRFEEHLQQAIHVARLQNRQVAVLFLDSNRFKEVNDRLGHAAGDAVLIHTSQRLRHHLRKGDLVARLGGDEFAVLLTNINSLEEAQLIADKISSSMALPIPLPDGNIIHSSLSIGIAVFPEHASNPGELTHQADAAMYDAKRNKSGPQMVRSPTE